MLDRAGHACCARTRKHRRPSLGRDQVPSGDSEADAPASTDSADRPREPGPSSLRRRPYRSYGELTGVRCPRRRRWRQTMCMTAEDRGRPHWIPLGAGGHSVRVNGIVCEVISSLIQRRPRQRLPRRPGDPRPERTVRDRDDTGPERARLERVSWRGGSRDAIGRSTRILRYESAGDPTASSPTWGDAVASPVRISDDPPWHSASWGCSLDAEPTWGRDELGTGEMWTCNSVMSGSHPRLGLPGRDRLPPTRAGTRMGRGRRRCRRQLPSGPGRHGRRNGPSDGGARRRGSQRGGHVPFVPADRDHRPCPVRPAPSTLGSCRGRGTRTVDRGPARGRWRRGGRAGRITVGAMPAIFPSTTG